MNKKKIVIFGGQGFLGVNICKYFLKYSTYQLISIGNRSKNKNNFFSAQERKKITFLEFDIFEYRKISKLDLNGSIVIFAAINGIQPQLTFLVKLRKLFLTLKKNNIKKFFLLSSVSVYGNYIQKLNENIKTKTLNKYAKNCLIAEKISTQVFAETKVNLIILRIAQVFGLYKTKYGIIEKILKYYLKNDAYAFNAVNLIRSHISAVKIVKIIHFLSKKEINNELLNISNPFYIFSFEDLVRKIEKILGFKKKINLEHQSFVIKNSICAPTKLQKKYRIKFKNNFSSEIKHVIRNFNRYDWS